MRVEGLAGGYLVLGDGFIVEKFRPPGENPRHQSVDATNMCLTKGPLITTAGFSPLEQVVAWNMQGLHQQQY